LLPAKSPQPCAAAGVAGLLRSLAILAVLALIVWTLSDIALLIFMAVLFAVMLRGVTDWTAERTGVSASTALICVTLAVAALMLGFLVYLRPRLIVQSSDLWSQLNQQFDHLRDLYGDTLWGKALFGNRSLHTLVQGHIARYAGSVATSTLGGIVTALVLVATTLYFANAPALYINGTIRLFPLPYRVRARSILAHIGGTLRRWALGQLIDMAVTMWVAVIFLVYHGIEGYLVAPLVQRNTADLPPALTILSMTILGTLLGPLGIIVGAPVAAATLVIVREAYVGDLLGENSGPTD
jgi:predicted PurR-regulated permease PerM